MIKIIVLGKIKEQYLNELINDYLKRINNYHKVSIIELKDENDLLKERDSILKQITKGEYIIALDINGHKINSNEFAKKLDNLFITNSTITFIIGSSEGLHQDIKDKAHYLLSFSNFTFPHGLFRGILLEQIYRAFKINNNETYHK